MAYPSVVTAFTTPNPTDRLNSPSHSSIESAQNTGLSEIQTFVGTLSSISGTLMYDIRAAASGGGGHVQAVNKGGTGQTSYTKGDILVATSSSVLTKLAVGTDTQAIIADSTQAAGLKWGSPGKFGGTGSDGALTVASGTTTISIASVQTFIKNYTSIAITGTGKVNFTSPHTNGTTIILKSQGAVTLTSSQTPALDASGMGGQNDNGYGFTLIKTFDGQPTPGSGNGGGGGSVAGLAVASIVGSQLSGKYPFVVPGAGGGGGGSQRGGGGGGGSAINAGNAGANGTNAATDGNGSGGAGGGVLIIECAGALNMTQASVISVNGVAGAAGSGTNSGGGGGGGAGIGLVFYGSLTASVAGGITSAGGAGGAAQGNGGAGGAGGAGYSLVASNTEFT